MTDEPFTTCPFPSLQGNDHWYKIKSKQKHSLCMKVPGETRKIQRFSKASNTSVKSKAKDKCGWSLVCWFVHFFSPARQCKHLLQALDVSAGYVYLHVGAKATCSFVWVAANHSIIHSIGKRKPLSHLSLISTLMPFVVPKVRHNSFGEKTGFCLRRHRWRTAQMEGISMLCWFPTPEDDKRAVLFVPSLSAQRLTQWKKKIRKITELMTLHDTMLTERQNLELCLNFPQNVHVELEKLQVVDQTRNMCTKQHNTQTHIW